MANAVDQDVIRAVTDNDKRMAIINAVADYDVVNSTAWDKLARLSPQTEFEAIDAVPEGLFEHRPGEFEAVATVFVTLRYGGETDQRSMGETYPVLVRGTYDRGSGTASITILTVDTPSCDD